MQPIPIFDLIPLSLVVKVVLVTAGVIYSIIALLIARQTQLMRAVLDTKLDSLFIMIANAQLIFSVALTIFALFI